MIYYVHIYHRYTVRTEKNEGVMPQTQDPTSQNNKSCWAQVTSIRHRFFLVEQLGKFQGRLWWLLDGKMELVATLKFTTLLPRIGVSTGSRGHQIKDIKDSLWCLLLNFSGKHNVIQSRYHRSTSYSRTLFLSSENWKFFTANKWNKVHETVYPINIISYRGIPKATSLKATCSSK